MYSFTTVSSVRCLLKIFSTSLMRWTFLFKGEGNAIETCRTYVRRQRRGYRLMNLKWIIVWSQTPIETVLAALLQVEDGCVISQS